MNIDKKRFSQMIIKHSHSWEKVCANKKKIGKKVILQGGVGWGGGGGRQKQHFFTQKNFIRGEKLFILHFLLFKIFS